MKKEQDKRSASPQQFPLMRNGYLVTRPLTRKPSRPTTPNPTMERQQWFPSRPCKSAWVRVHDERQSHKETQQPPSKSKRLFKADDMLFPSRPCKSAWLCSAGVSRRKNLDES